MDEMGVVVTHQDVSHIAPVLSDAEKDRPALVVTADARIRKQCREVAIAAGFSVEMTEKGVSALNLARTLCPELIFLDLELRDVHGLELVTWLRSDPVLRRVPIIAISAFSEDRQDPRAGCESVVAILSKPLRSKYLERFVRDRGRAAG